jgi:hypothetical protein
MVRTDDKRRGRLNCISHILSSIPHGKPETPSVELPKRMVKNRYDDHAALRGRRFAPERY